MSNDLKAQADALEALSEAVRRDRENKPRTRDTQRRMEQRLDKLISASPPKRDPRYL